MAADDYQVGGDHYKNGGEEHWTRIWRLYGRGYFVGSATKYIERYHRKDGIKDLEKALHFIKKLIELETEEKERTDGFKAVSGNGTTDDGGSGKDSSASVRRGNPSDSVG